MVGTGASLAATALLATATLAAEPAGPPSSSWSWSLSAIQYWLPNDPDFLLGVGAADHGPIHLEARWQYEDLRTVSAFAGWKLVAGENLRLEATPMAGALVGRTNGLVPGLEADLTWRFLRLYTENEFVLALNESSTSYFYAWTELTTSPFEFLTVGLVLQRTRQVRTSFEIQRGALARVRYRGITLGVSAFNFFSPEWYVSTGLTIER